jgi:hypothetical protein
MATPTNGVAMPSNSWPARLCCRTHVDTALTEQHEQTSVRRTQSEYVLKEHQQVREPHARAQVVVEVTDAIGHGA